MFYTVMVIVTITTMTALVRIVSRQTQDIPYMSLETSVGIISIAKAPNLGPIY